MNLADLFRARHDLAAVIRSFFNQRGFLEVETPFLVKFPDLNPNLSHFVVQGDSKNALITSPEFAMKKLLGQGLQKIFTLARVFRNGETETGRHLTEFTMLEWYEQGANYQAGMTTTEELVRSCLPHLNFEFRRLHLPSYFRELTGIDFAGATLEEMRSVCQNFGLRTETSDSWSDLFQRFFVVKIEPTLTGAIFIYDFPRQEAALAALTDDGRYAQRFELYVNGLELCNAFTELTDPFEQRRRFEEELAERTSRGLETFPIDEGLLRLLPSIRYPTFGNALGLERLLMLVLGKGGINDVAIGN